MKSSHGLLSRVGLACAGMWIAGCAGAVETSVLAGDESTAQLGGETSSGDTSSGGGASGPGGAASGGGAGGASSGSSGVGGATSSSSSGGAGAGCPGMAGQSPMNLPDGRTYDQQKDYIVWSGPVSYVTLQHKDGTSLPASEGGVSCGSKCTEQVTRIEDGGSISGRFQDLETFSFQPATEDDPSAGTAVLEVCGQVVGSFALQGGNGLAGFSNQPQPAWPVPTGAEYVWTIRATGGHVDVRAVTVKYIDGTTPPPAPPS